MNYNILSPYVRRAIYSTLQPHFDIKRRIIFDYEIILVDSGEFILTTETGRYHCKPGDAVFLRPGVHHSFKSVGDLPLVQPHIHFDMCCDGKSEEVYICFKPFDALTFDEKQLIRRDTVDIPVPEVFKSDNIQYFRAQLYEIIELTKQRADFYQLLRKEKMLALLRVVFSQFDTEKKLPPSSSEIDMLNIKSYIDSNYTDKITLVQLEKRFWLSRFYIDVNFKKHFGIPVIKYYSSVKFKAACRLLESGAKVGEAGEKLGFDNIFAFSRFFKNACGKSPSAYRKSKLGG